MVKIKHFKECMVHQYCLEPDVTKKDIIVGAKALARVLFKGLLLIRVNEIIYDFEKQQGDINEN